MVNNEDSLNDFIKEFHVAVTDKVKSLRISKITVTPQSIQLYVTAEITNVGIRDLGLLTTITVSPEEQQPYHFLTKFPEYGITMEGNIVIASRVGLLGRSGPGETTYDTDIVPQALLPITGWCTGIVIDGTVYTGNIILEAATGIELKVVHTEGSKTQEQATIVSIGIPALAILENHNELTNSVLAKLEEKFKEGVTSINGLQGDVTITKGKYTVGRELDSSKTTDANNLQVTTSGKSILITNSVDVPTYDINQGSGSASLEGSIALLLENAKALNERAGSLERHNYALDSAVNLLGAQLAKVD
jgi:hypothetical protein